MQNVNLGIYPKIFKSAAERVGRLRGTSLVHGAGGAHGFGGLIGLGVGFAPCAALHTLDCSFKPDSVQGNLFAEGDGGEGRR